MTRILLVTESAFPGPDGTSGTLKALVDRLVDTARDYAKASTAENTNRAYAADWKHFTRWCRMKGVDPLPPSPEMIALYLADLAGQPLLGLAIDLGLGLYVGLEGRNLRAQALQRRGWRLVDVIEAGDADTAFDIHAARATLPGRQSAPHVTRPSRQLITTGRAAGRQHGSIGLVPVERN